MWTCTKCSERIEGAFEICWACGTTIDGVEDPNFFATGDEGKPSAEHLSIGGMPENLVTVTRCMAPAEAYAIKVHLESAGIHVFLADEFTVTMDWLLSNAVGGIKVQVPETELAQASEILGIAAEEESDEDDLDEDSEPDTSFGPAKCARASTRTTRTTAPSQMNRNDKRPAFRCDNRDGCRYDRGAVASPGSPQGEFFHGHIAILRAAHERAFERGAGRCAGRPGFSHERLARATCGRCKPSGSSSAGRPP